MADYRSGQYLWLTFGMSKKNENVEGFDVESWDLWENVLVIPSGNYLVGKMVIRSKYPGHTH